MPGNGGSFPELDARCPACGERSLFRGFQGRISCSTDDCPAPAAVHNLLNDPNLTAHTVCITENGWTIRHPLAERIGDALFTCDLAGHLNGQRQANSDLAPGVYRLDISPRGKVWHLTPINNDGLAVEVIEA